MHFLRMRLFLVLIAVEFRDELRLVFSNSILNPYIVKET